MDFTFNNELIKKYFDGDDSYIPSSELMYLHTHPLITPNFLTQLEELILKAGEVLVRRNIKQSHVVTRFEEIAIKIGTNLPVITNETAPIIMEAMREAYKLSLDIIDKLG